MEKKDCDTYRNSVKNVYKSLHQSLEKRRPLALATVVATEGSTPQTPGASALFSRKGLVEGTLGGGLMEGWVSRQAREALDKKIPLLVGFDLRDDFSSSDSAVCGGKVQTLIDGNPQESREVFARLIQSLNHRQSGVLAVLIQKTKQKNFSLTRFWIEDRDSGIKPPRSLEHLEKDICGVLEKRKPRFFQFQDENQKPFSGKEENYLFLEPVVPSLQLLIVGAGHVGKALSRLGQFLNFEVTVVDDRPEFANEEQIPEADHFIVEDIERAVRHFPVTKDTFIVIVTRGHSYDAQALKECIHSPAGYIGMMGSQRKVQLMKERFIKEGWSTEDQFERLRAPIGIPIQSQSVEEIAVSIAAQLVKVRNTNWGNE